MNTHSNLMALKPLIQFPIFSLPSHHHRPATEIRFSRWNNANADHFIRRDQAQKQLEDQIRSQKRFNAAERISHNYNPAPPYLTTFKSTGTPSSPSKSSIPGKFSKYSKKFNKNDSKRLPNSHPAFKPTVRTRKLPSEVKNETPDGKDSVLGVSVENNETPDEKDSGLGINVKVGEKGVVYEVPDAPFVYQYSYTETPKMRPLKMREPLVSPFGPETVNRPWTGRKPLPPSKKKLPEFDSFKLPPPNKKGVKPVQSPGPFVEGSGPRYAKTREELIGEPLSKQEIEELIKTCQNAKRQLNIGRDGLTHNMLENIHAHWKRRRVCKIKCKGVCTVDINNVHQQLEEKTGGKIISSKGGVLYLFRGRNYNYKTRPRFPLMLWRPVTPVYPRLVKRVPEGLTLEEATEMRKRGRNLIPICKLGKNGVYSGLAKNVMEAFEACELVRINCQGMNGSDFRKIGAKLRDLIKCVLISFEEEHILIWRGPDWKSSFDPNDELNAAGKSKVDKVALGLQTSEENAGSKLVSHETVNNGISDNLNRSTVPRDGETVELEECEEPIKGSESYMTSTSNMPSEASSQPSIIPEDYKSEGPLQIGRTIDDHQIALKESDEPKDMLDDSVTNNYESIIISAKSEGEFCNSHAVEEQSDLSTTLPQNGFNKLETSDNSDIIIKPVTTSILYTERVLKLREHAVETGSAIILADSDLNADTIFQKSTGLAKSAPPGPVFKYKPRRVSLNSSNEQKTSNSAEEFIPILEKEARSSGIKRGASGTKTAGRTPRNKIMEDLPEGCLNIAPRGSLNVNELAKLLS